MGYGGYSTDSRATRAVTDGFHTKSRSELFKQRHVHDSLSPQGLNVRECLDSTDHPHTIAVMLGLDVTGSMGIIPHELIKDGLPHIMSTIIEAGTPDVALCFLAIGDHINDHGSLQVAQFEASDELLDKHLQNVWLEGGGGGNGGESYPLAWYTAANHTKTDCFDKRGQKGVLITIGDENLHTDYPAEFFKEAFGPTCRVEKNTTAAELLAAAKEKWHVYHLGLPSGHTMSRWKELLGPNFIPVNDHNEVPKRVAEIVLKHSKDYAGKTFHVELVTKQDTPAPDSNIDDAVFIK
jgi:hypothetical protein